MGCINSKLDQASLFSAVKSGRVEDVRRLAGGLQVPIDSIVDGSKGQTLLHKGCRHLQPQVCEVLLQLGCKPDVRDQEHRTALHILVAETAKTPAKASQALQIQRMILEQSSPAQLDVHDRDSTPLLLAISSKQDTLARGFLEAKFTPAAVTKGDGCTALHLALRVGATPIIPAMLTTAAEMNVTARMVNQANREGSTPLHLAVAAGMPEAVQQLLQLSVIEMNAGDSQRNTPLHLALLALMANTPVPHMAVIARMLLAMPGCVIDAPNAAGQTAVSLAVDFASRACEGPGSDAAARMQTEALLLLAQGRGRVAVNKNVFNELGNRGMAAVHVAARLGRVDILTGLVGRKANIDLQDGMGLLPSVMAAQANHKAAVLAMFGPLKADTLAMDREGTSAVSHALLSSTYGAADAVQVVAAVIRGPSLGGTQRLATQPVTVEGTPGVRGSWPLLHLACAIGNLEAVEMLILEGRVPVDTPASQGLTPLAVTVAAYKKASSAGGAQGNKLVAVAEFLMRQGANPVAKDNTGTTALGKALDAGQLGLAMVMLRAARAHVDHAAPSGATALYVAIVQGNITCARELVLQFGASAGPQPTYIPLHVAVGTRNTAIVEMLLSTEQGQKSIALVDAANNPVLGYLHTPWSVLTLGTAHGPPSSTSASQPKDAAPKEDLFKDDGVLYELTRLLFRHRDLDVNALDAKGMRPLHWAVKLNKPQLIKVLATSERGLDSNLPDADGATPLFNAVQKGDLQLVQVMLDYLPKLDVAATSRASGVESGRTVLQAAVAAANTPLVTLLAARPDVQLDMKAFTLCVQLLETKPLACAAILAELLHPSRAKRCSIDLASGRSKVTVMVQGERLELPPLHLVARHDLPEMVQLLIKRAGASPNETDSKGQTPLHHAVQKRAYRAASELVDHGAMISVCADMGTTPLIAAAAMLDVGMVSLLLNSTTAFDVNMTDSAGHTALTTAMQSLLNAAMTVVPTPGRKTDAGNVPATPGAGTPVSSGQSGLMPPAGTPGPGPRISLGAMGTPVSGGSVGLVTPNMPPAGAGARPSLGGTHDLRGQLDQSTKSNLSMSSQQMNSNGSVTGAGKLGSAVKDAGPVDSFGMSTGAPRAFKLEPLQVRNSNALTNSFGSSDPSNVSRPSLSGWSNLGPSASVTNGNNLAGAQSNASAGLGPANSVTSALGTTSMAFIAASEDSLAIFYSLVQHGADVNRPLPTARQLASMMSTAGSLLSPMASVTPGGLPALDSNEVLTPLLAAICVRAVPVVELLLQVPTLDVNGLASFPALHMALQGVYAVFTAASDELARSSVGSSVIPAKAAGSKFSIFGGKKQQATRAPVPAAPNHIPEARNAAMHILRLVAADPRVDLLQPRPGSDKSCYPGGTVLCQLAALGGPEVVELVRDLLASGRDLDVNGVDAFTGRTALHLAAARADSDLLDELAVAPGVDLNALDKDGRTPLACAVAAGAPDAVRGLLARGRGNLRARAALDPCLYGNATPPGPDPAAAAAPMALALAQQDVRVLEALVQGAEAANDLVVASSAAGLQSGLALAASITGSRRRTDVATPFAAGSIQKRASPTGPAQAPGSKYDVLTLVNAPVDAVGRPPILTAILKFKLEHAMTLVKAGARLDVQEESAEQQAQSGMPVVTRVSGASGIASALSELATVSISPQGSANLPQASGALAPSVSTSAPSEDTDRSTPFSLLCQLIIELEPGKSKDKGKEAKVKLAQDLLGLMAEQESMDQAMAMRDGIGFNALHWAVLAKHKRAVELLSVRAQRLGLIDTKATSDKGQGFTALHLAAQLGLVEIAQVLMVLGAATVDVASSNGTTPLLVSKTEGMHHLLSNPPAAISYTDIQAGVPGLELPKIKKDGFFTGTIKGAKNQLITTWEEVVSTPGLEKLNKKVKEDPGKFVEGSKRAKDGTVVVSNISAQQAGKTTSLALYGAFRAALKMGMAAGQALGPVGAAVGALCSVADSLLTNMEFVVLNNVIMGHMCGRIRRQLPTLQALKKACESKKVDAQAEFMRDQLLPHIQSLGELYIDVHGKVEEWGSTGKASLISRMLTSNEYYKDFMQLEMMLTARMTDLGVAINVSKILENCTYQQVEQVDKAEVENSVRDAIRADMQMAMRDILEADAMVGDVSHSKAVKMFKDHGLDYNRLKRAERKRWRNDKILDLMIPSASLEVIQEVGVGGTAHVFMARWNGHPVAFKRFEYLPQAAEILKEAVENEGFIMSTLRHPNIMQLYGLVCDKNQYGLVVDYHPRGSLQKLVEVSPGETPLTIPQRVALALQIARGMAYLHGRCFEPIVHGDLKPSNVLVSDDGRAVITDFGLARIASNTTTTASSAPSHGDSFSSNASAVYTAPEVMQQLLDNKRRQPQGDVFAFGVLMLELMTLNPAHTGFALNSTDYTNKIATGQRPPVPPHLPPVLQFCIQQCWHHVPTKRLPFTTIVDMLDDVYASLATE